MTLRTTILATVACLAFASGGWAQAPAVKPTAPAPPAMPAVPRAVGLDKLVEKADSIVLGRVAQREARFVDGNIETTYVIDVEKDFRGKHSRSTGPVEVTLRGGQLEGLPLGQLVRGNPHMAPGEEVLLFLDTRVEERQAANTALRASRGQAIPAPNPKSRLHTSPRIVGREKGKFTVMTLSNGQRFISRQSIIGTVLDDNSAQVLSDYQKNQLEARLATEASTAARGGNSRAAGAESSAGQVPVEIGGNTTRAAAEPQTANSREPAGQIKPIKAPIPVPYNADAMAQPVTLDLFEAELTRLVGQPASK